MSKNDRRLDDYLREVEAIHEWNADPDTTRRLNPRPDWPAMTRLEQQAFTMGRLSEFEAAGAKRIDALVGAEIEDVRRSSPAAADAHRDDVRWREMQSYERDYEEAQFRKERMVRRWEVQEAERSAARKDHVWDRLGGKRMPPRADVSGAQPDRAKGGFAGHAKRESALDEARQSAVARCHVASYYEIE